MVDMENPADAFPKRTKSEKHGRTPPPLSPTSTILSMEDTSPRTITIGHQVLSNNNHRHSARSATFLLGMSKPVFAMVAATLFATTGSAAWLVSRWLTIPGLQGQIQELETEVNRLENQVDRLAEEVDVLALENGRYAQLNVQLNETAEDYRELNSQLNASTLRMESLNDQLNHSNSVFRQLNAQLILQNELYASMNAQLNDTVEDLQLVAGFSNETSTTLQQSFESITNYLAEQISVSRLLVLETLKNTYQQRMQNWDCGVRDYFAAERFLRDGALPINYSNETTLPIVLGYIQDQLLSDLCLSRVDFESYLEGTYGVPDDITFNELLQGATRYATLAMRYYFPSSTSTSTGDSRSNSPITAEEWAFASYQCASLPREYYWG
jgi:archaellum component FlaC